jgi:2-iminobutanoate/2-iminopropanoate deaminase
MTKTLFSTATVLITALILSGCNNAEQAKMATGQASLPAQADTAEYFNLRPKLEKEYGYTHAVKIGHHLKISWAVSMNDSGIIVAPGNMEQQMKNCYSDLEKMFPKARGRTIPLLIC